MTLKPLLWCRSAFFRASNQPDSGRRPGPCPGPDGKPGRFFVARQDGQEEGASMRGSDTSSVAEVRKILHATLVYVA